MHRSSSTTWCGHRQALWLTSQPAWSTGLIATSRKHLSSLTGMGKSLPKTTRGREEPGRAQQSTDSHWQPLYLAATKWWKTSPVAPPAVLEVISCSCKAGLKPCLTAKCSCVAAGLACTSYCFCKGYDSTCCNSLTHSQQEEQYDKNVESGEEDEDDEDEFYDEDMLYNSAE